MANDITSAETLSLEAAVDNAVYLSTMFRELYFGQLKERIPIIVNEDSKCLVESLYSTKKVKKKTMRLAISSLQQHIKEGVIKRINHVSSKDQLSDVLTKKGVLTDRMIDAVSKGTLLYEEEKSFEPEEKENCGKYSVSSSSNSIDEASANNSVDDSINKSDTKPFWKRIWRKFDNMI